MAMDPVRPNPDALLAAIQKDESRQQRGRLKLFFGMAAGVGKTYAMLQAAHERAADGVDVVVGYVETHGRVETEALLAGLAVLPRRRVEYRGTTLEEMDLDAILRRKPELVLVDELAHTNAPGARHLKRYQDVVELLEAGIDVYTTVNVQHFESRADAVRQITGIAVQERAPDSLLDLADEIELIDLSPDDLRKRLAEGKVHTPERVEVAAQNFFRVGNLTALREMALRLTAEHVDHKLQDYMEAKRIAGPWKSSERLMVAIGPSPFSEQIIRWTRRIAYNLEAPWLAAYIETSRPLHADAQERLARNLELAQRLGGEIVTASGDDVAGTLLYLARQHNATQIVIGKSRHPRWQDWLRGGSLVDRLIERSDDIDIYVVMREEDHAGPSLHPAAAMPIEPSPLRAYLFGIFAIAAVTLLLFIAYEMFPSLTYQAVGLLELLMVLLIAVYLGRGPALAAAFISAFSLNFLFITPRFTVAITHLQDIILFLLYFLVALIAGNLAARLRTQERHTRRNAERTQALYTLAHETATAVDMDDVLRTAVTQIGAAFDAEVAILQPVAGRLDCRPYSASTMAVDEKDFAVAVWVFENSRRAGRFTDTLPQASGQYLPLRSPSRTVGVLGIHMRQPSRPAFDQEVLLEMFTNQVALVIERELLDEAAEQAVVLRESERLYNALLSSISHELRTPIAAITGAASLLQNEAAAADPGLREGLTGDIAGAADRLNRLVENLLDMSRLEAGRIQLKLDWCDVGDVIGVAAQRVTACLQARPFRIDLAPGLPLVRMDFVLVEQVLINLLVNACTYTPPGTPLAVSAWTEREHLHIAVTDQGPGIPAAERERIFDKFYRLPGSAAGGTGLGLSICRGLVEAHGGTLRVEDTPAGGAQFVITLPAASTPPPVQEAQQ